MIRVGSRIVGTDMCKIAPKRWGARAWRGHVAEGVSYAPFYPIRHGLIKMTMLIGVGAVSVILCLRELVGVGSQSHLSMRVSVKCLRIPDLLRRRVRVGR